MDRIDASRETDGEADIGLHVALKSCELELGLYRLQRGSCTMRYVHRVRYAVIICGT